MALRKSQFWMDNAANALTDFSSELNNVVMSRNKEVLDDTGLNDDYVQRAQIGLIDGSFAINGYVRNADTGIVKSLEALFATSITKTVQWKLGARYYNAEIISDGVVMGAADGRALIPFSCTLFADGAINKTSVAL